MTTHRERIMGAARADLVALPGLVAELARCLTAVSGGWDTRSVRTAPAGNRGLTHSSESSREGLAMKLPQRRPDLIGQQFGRLTIIEFSHIGPHGAAVWTCHCDCGETLTAATGRLRRGRPNACESCTAQAYLERRFWTKVERTQTCWLWTGCVNEDGYGTFSYDGKVRKAHRAAYAMFVGPIPDGLEIDHKCRTRNCVNPDHLQPATHKQNCQNRIAPIRQGAA